MRLKQFAYKYIAAACVSGGAVQLTEAGVEQLLQDNQLVLINFYADWCGYGQTKIQNNKAK